MQILGNKAIIQEHLILVLRGSVGIKTLGIIDNINKSGSYKVILVDKLLKRNKDESDETTNN